MKKIFASLFLISLLAVPVVGFAQTEMGMIKAYEGCVIKHDLSDYQACWLDEVQPIIKDTTIEDPAYSHCCLVDKILTIGDWIFTALLVIAIIIILLAAFTFLTASGDPDKVTKGRNYLIYALVGIAVAFLAKVLVRVVASIMT